MTNSGDDSQPTGSAPANIQRRDSVGAEPDGSDVELLPPEEIKDFSTAKGPSKSSAEVDLHHAKAAAKLAYIFAAAIFSMFLMNFGAVVYFTHSQPKDALDAIDHVFATWTPIFSGFVASAVTFYYTQNKR
jgi:hypothetical protein